MASTKKPNGLSITRDGGLKYVVSWKVTDKDYGAGQQVRWRVQKKNGKTTAWTTRNVSSNIQTKAFTLTASDWAPNANKPIVAEVQVQVRGKRSSTTESGKTTTYDWSDWAKIEWKQKTPDKPKIEKELTSANQTEFSWDVNTSSTGNKPFTQVQWQSILQKACKETNGSKLNWKSSTSGWQTGTGSASGTKSITEDSTILSQDSYTRWFRARSRGVAGDSDWRYSKHVYAKPNKPVISSATATESGTTTTVVVNWKAGTNAAHPIDDVTVEYMIATPAANLACPTGGSWSEGVSIKDTSGMDAAKFTVDEVVGVDECMYVRVVANHDLSENPNNKTASKPVLAKKGSLAAPTINNVSTNAGTHKVTIEAVNNSEVPDANIAVLFKMEGVNTVIAVIPAGQTTASGVQCPNWGNKTIVFGLKAFQGEYTEKIGVDGVKDYSLQKNMYSATVWQSGNVPKEPEDVTADAATDATGEVIVTWSWSWPDANQAEISWSTNPNAWESTDTPQTFVLDNTYAARWRIANLETGKTWYFAVRLMIVNDDGGVTYGPYCDPVAVNLSSAPNIPLLALSAGTIPVTGEVTASWEYETTDGTDQAYAEICEAIYTASGIKYGTYFQSEDTKVTVTEDGEEQLNGKKYYTRSGSGTYNSPYTYTEVSYVSFYALTSDVTINSSKTYYTRSGSGTTQSPYVFTKVASPNVSYISTYYEASANPNTSSWYEYQEAIAHENTARHVTIKADRWTPGNTYYLAVRVTSESGRVSAWSDPVPIYVVDELEAEISSTSLSSVTIQDGDGGSRTVTALESMPLTATITGAGAGGTTTLIIIRNDEYHMDRPDETQRDGYEGETIALVRKTGEDQITINQGDLYNMLDDGAKYKLIAVVEDGYGQSNQKEIEFEVHWEHQAGIPTATVETEADVAVITPVAPQSYVSGDTCDIYRLSVDPPQLIFQGAAFGTKYVDPFPTLGEHAGYRCVCVTANGDYIDASNRPAWVDVRGQLFDRKTGVIDFDGEKLEVKFNVGLDNNWTKDFKETKYLNGTVIGDWNPAVSRSGTVNAVLLTEDAESIRKVRRLADYSGICHVRTQDGSSFSADIQVSNGQEYGNGGQIEELTLRITRIEPEFLDGIPYSEWKVS